MTLLLTAMCILGQNVDPTKSVDPVVREVIEAWKEHEKNPKRTIKVREWNGKNWQIMPLNGEEQLCRMLTAKFKGKTLTVSGTFYRDERHDDYNVVITPFLGVHIPGSKKFKTIKDGDRVKITFKIVWFSSGCLYRKYPTKPGKTYLLDGIEMHMDLSASTLPK